MRFFNRMTNLSMSLITEMSLKALIRLKRQIIIAALGSIALITGLQGCAEFPGVYKVKIEQGNIIDADMLALLKVGETKEQVEFILGSPLIKDTFSEDRWDYTYRVKHDDKYIKEKELVVYFENGLVSRFTHSGL